MSLERDLANQLVRKYPGRAADVLEHLGSGEATRVLARAAASESAPVLQRMSPAFAAGILGSLDTEKLAEVLEVLPLDVASRLFRRLPPERGEQALEKASARLARSLRSQLRFPEGSAGALMDPEVLALPEGITAREGLDRVRSAAESARYNIYVVDQEQRLVGALNLRELLLARPAARLADLMVRHPHRLDARADRSVVIAHPGWREVHCLPVVDEKGGYLGAIRYRTLRSLEEELLGGRGEDANVREALGRLFAVGAGGLLDALTSPGATRPGGSSDGPKTS